jgi:uncharacterized membrane protein YczE
MKNLSFRLFKLIGGLFLYSLGIIITIKANIGYSPWDIFHVGLAQTFDISIGTASILTGLIIGIITILLDEKLGLGTILNMVCIGIFIDILIKLNFIHKSTSFSVGILMMILGLFIIAFASYFYINSSFGAGPRDSLMVALSRKTKLPVGLCRGSIEIIALLCGWKLGGMVGVGTILSAFCIGFCIQLTFKVLKFDVSTVKHETLKDTFNSFGSLKQKL